MHRRIEALRADVKIAERTIFIGELGFCAQQNVISRVVRRWLGVDPMVKVFFQVQRGDTVIPDLEGADFPDLADAKRDAEAALHEFSPKTSDTSGRCSTAALRLWTSIGTFWPQYNLKLRSGWFRIRRTELRRCLGEHGVSLNPC